MASLRWLTAVLAATSLAFLGATEAQECSVLTENTLTSDGCPSDCNSDPCVLYSPVQAPCVPMGASGLCYFDANFTLPAESTTCNMTYQCLDSIMYDQYKWLLSLDPNKNVNSITTAVVTEIVELEYPNNVLSVQLSGGTTTTRRSEMKDVLLDQSFFDTPSGMGYMYLESLNLRSIMATVSFSADLVTLSIRNSNLDEVPSQLTNISSLTKLGLAMNYITEMPEADSEAATAMAMLTELNLSHNSLSNFSLEFEHLSMLDLSVNPFAEIPETVYAMVSSGKLKELYMASCNLTNVKVSEAQFIALNSLSIFDVDVTITDCGEGYAATNLEVAGVQVCFPSTEITESDNGGGGHILPIVLGVACGVLVICIMVFVLYRRHRGKDVFPTKGSAGTDPFITDMTDGTFGSSIWNDPDLVAVRIDHRHVEAIRLISRGGFGEVWIGRYMNEDVAIKRLLSSKRTMPDALEFASEIRIMARLDHPKIVQFIGVSWTNPLSIQAISEYMDCGDLKTLLDSPRAESLTWGNIKCQIAIDISDALVYLHTLEPKLIHRDLKSRNVLIDAQRGAKLSDFGVSRNRSVDETMTAGVGTARWIAPEVILGGHYTEFADIYSLGVVFSELDTCQAPFYDATNTNGTKMQDVTILQLVSAGKLQPSFSKSCPAAVVELGRACMQFEPSDRPTAIQISYELRKIMKDLA